MATATRSRPSTREWICGRITRYASMRKLPVRAIHTSLIVLATIPVAFIVFDVLRDRLGPNPIEVITHRTGDWTIRLLLTTLAVSPLRQLTGWNELIQYRRTLGLLTFSYACLHFLIYLV